MYGRFRFHPVGQGLFYTGCIQQKKDRLYNFVYDCGVEFDLKNQAKRGLSKAINNHLAFLKRHEVQKKDKPVIDFVAISHFDYDHFSGLFELQQNSQIKKYYFPYIGDPNSPIVWHIFDRLQYNDDFIQTNQGSEIISRMRDLYNNGEFVGEDFENYDGLNDRDLEKVYIIRNSSRSYSFSDNKKLWCFDLFNKEVDPQLIIEFNKQVFSKFKTYDIEKLIRNAPGEWPLNTIRRDLNKIYSDVFNPSKKGSNITSLILTHYPAVGADTEINCNYYPYSGCRSCNELSKHNVKECGEPCGYHCAFHSHCCTRYYNAWSDIQASATTILTGDAEFDFGMINNLNDILLKIKSNLKIIQVPHHGSNQIKTPNWDMLGSLKFDFDWYIIPFGYGNRYGHPDSSVISELQSNYKDFAYATQRNYFEYRIRF